MLAGSRSLPLLRLVRWQNWWFAKIPMLLAASYAMVILNSTPPARAFLALAGILVSLCSLASFGYAVNDIFDMEEDRQSNKANAMTELLTGRRFMLCAFFAASGFLPWLWADFGQAAALILAVNYLFPLAYSLPPLRLKDRGGWGVFADAAGVHALPTLFVVVIFSHDVKRMPVGLLFLALAFVTWSFLFGLRGILIHQLQDLKNDVKPRSGTLAVRSGAVRVSRFGRRLLFPLEATVFTAMTAGMLPFTPLPLLLFLLYGLFDLQRHKVWKISFDPLPAARNTYIFLADFYEVWLPLALATALLLRDLRFLPVLAAHLFLFFMDIRKRKDEVFTLANELQRRSREG